MLALWALWLFRQQLPERRALQLQGGVVIVLLLAGFIGAEKLSGIAETHLYQDEIVFTETTWLAGKPPRLACSRTTSSFGAM